jgi:eukaryotic-like serine/threonine-protein kinase
MGLFELDATVASTTGTAQSLAGTSLPPPVGGQPTSATRSITVLPRVQLTPEGARMVRPDKARYETVKTLGEGAFGEVALAMDNDIERRVAVKRIKASALDEDAILRFVSEVQSVGRLEHPGIVPIHDVGIDEHGYFFVMKYVDGETLESVISKLRAGDRSYLSRYSMEARAQLVLQLCRAVQFAHNKGYIHRDIKPANIMIGTYGEVVLMDWGLAKKISDTGAHEEMYQRKPMGQEAFGTMLGFAIGTPAYMAPEQARGEHDRTDGRSDVYSLCAVFFELLTLRHYLEPKPNAKALLEAVKTEEPMGPIAMHHQHQVSPELAWLVSKGLAKDPLQRYQSLGEMCARIQAALEGKGPVQCPCTALKRAGGEWNDFINRHPIIAVGSAVLVALFSLTGIAAALLTVVRALG